MNKAVQWTYVVIIQSFSVQKFSNYKTKSNKSLVFIHSSSNHLLSIYFVLSPILTTGDIVVNGTDKDQALLEHKFYLGGGRG